MKGDRTAWVLVSKKSLYSGLILMDLPSIFFMVSIITVQAFRNSSLASHLPERELQSDLARPCLPVAFLVILLPRPGKTENNGYGGLTRIFTSSLLVHNFLLG